MKPAADKVWHGAHQHVLCLLGLPGVGGVPACQAGRMQRAEARQCQWLPPSAGSVQSGWLAHLSSYHQLHQADADLAAYGLC